MFSQFEEEAQKVLLKAKEEKEELNHPYIGSEHLLLAILSNNDLEITRELNKYNITYDRFKKEIINSIGIGNKGNKWFLYTPLLKKIIEGAIYDTKDNDEVKVSVYRLFLSLLEEGDGVAIRTLMAMNIDIEVLYEVFTKSLNIKVKKDNKKALINEYGIDLTSLAKNNEFDPVVDRDKEILRLQEILIRKTKNNPILIGEAGVGKTAIVEGLAMKIVNGDVIDELKNKKIISISMSSLVAGTKYRGEFEEKLNKIIKELENDDSIILFIDEVHTLVGAGGAEGAIDASNILKPALARNKIRIIGATTNKEYTKYIEKDSALTRRFQKIDVLEPNYEKTKNILNKLKATYEEYHNIIIDPSLIDMIIKMSNKYILDRKQPDKAIDLLDEACTKAIVSNTKEDIKMKKYRNSLKEIIKNKNTALKNQDYEKASKLRKKELKIESTINMLNMENNVKYLTKENIYQVLEDKMNIPINHKLNSKYLNKVIRKLNQKIIGQPSIIEDLIKETKVINFNQDKVKAYLLVGPSGVGKTSLIEAYQKIFYNNFLKINMNEYKDEASINKLLGSPPGYVGHGSSNYIFEEVRKHPRTLILIENIDKASPSVLKIIMEILHESNIRSSNGDNISFKNSIIFMISTIDINQNDFGYIKKNNNLTKYFSEELLGNIDKVWVFNKLNKSTIKKIVNKKLQEISKRYIGELTIDIDPSEIIKESNYKIYGANKIDRIIEDKIKSIILSNCEMTKKDLFDIL